MSRNLFLASENESKAAKILLLGLLLQIWYLFKFANFHHLSQRRSLNATEGLKALAAFKPLMKAHQLFVLLLQRAWLKLSNFMITHYIRGADTVQRNIADLRT